MSAPVTPIKPAKLNADIREVEVGVRELRKIKIYPLSAKNQFELTQKLLSVIDEVSTKFSSENMTNEDAITMLQILIEENLEVILEYVIDKEELPTFDELTNNQVYIIANIIFEVNFENAFVNFKGLVDRAKKLF